MGKATWFATWVCLAFSSGIFVGLSKDAYAIGEYRFCGIFAMWAATCMFLGLKLVWRISDD